VFKGFNVIEDLGYMEKLSLTIHSKNYAVKDILRK